MKKRAMKKWIPYDLCYCCDCKWLSSNETKHNQLSGYCKYLHSGDWMKDGTFLLWDGCKECGEHDNDSLYWLRESKREGKENLKEERRNKRNGQEQLDKVILTKEDRLEAYEKIFGDDEDYINSFLNQDKYPINTYIDKEEKKPFFEGYKPPYYFKTDKEQENDNLDILRQKSKRNTFL